MKNFFDLQRFENINIGTGISNTLVSGTKAADSIDNAGAIITIQAAEGNDTIENKGQIVKIYGESGNDYIYNISGKTVTIFGGAGNDTVENGYSYSSTNFCGNDGVIISLDDGNDEVTNWLGNKVSISGGAGNDYIRNYSRSWNTGSKDVTISGGTGNDTIYLGDDADTNVIQYTKGDGADVIYGFNSTDTLRITAKSFSTMTSGDDFFVLFDDGGSITLKDAADAIATKNIVTVSGGNSGGDDDGGKLPTGLSLSGTTMTASKKFKGSAIDLTKYPKVKTLNASAVTKALKITGNTLANKISGGSKNDTIYGGNGNDSLVGNAGNDKLFGDAGNDTLVGGAGNDTLTGGKGKDVFVHSKGNDVIADYQAGKDKIKLNSALKTVKVSGKNVVITTEDGTVTVNNGKGKEITLATKISASASKNVSPVWFAEENNFVTADNLSTIVKNDLSVSADKIETTTYETFTVKNDLITYSGK